MNMHKSPTKRMLLSLTAIAAVSSLAVLIPASGARAQSVTVPPCSTCSPGYIPTPPTIPTTPPPTVTIPTPPPVVIVPPPPPPVVVVTPPPSPTPPTGMFTNVPSDMRRMTQFDTVTSINRLSEPGTLNLSIPRQAIPNKLENRTLSGAKTGMESDRAIQALENAKPLI
jgi:hypothetical protein